MARVAPSSGSAARNAIPVPIHQPFLFDLVIDVARFSPTEVAEIVAAAVLTARFGEAPLHLKTMGNASVE
jgi:hypothetical protein